jgi:hypothetical protein
MRINLCTILFDIVLNSFHLVVLIILNAKLHMSYFAAEERDEPAFNDAAYQMWIWVLLYTGCGVLMLVGLMTTR